MKILLTAFDPFGGEEINAAQEILESVKAPEQTELITLVVPTTFGESINTVVEAMRKENPDVVLCLGQAAGRNAITIERVAINLCDANINDNAGKRLTDVPVIEGAPAAYFTNMPVKEMQKAIRAANIPVKLSTSAGTFVCNELMYGVLHYIQNEFPNTLGGFIHVPCLPEQAERLGYGLPTMHGDKIAEAVSIALNVLAG